MRLGECYLVLTSELPLSSITTTTDKGIQSISQSIVRSVTATLSIHSLCVNKTGKVLSLVIRHQQIQHFVTTALYLPDLKRQDTAYHRYWVPSQDRSSFRIDWIGLIVASSSVESGGELS